MDVFDPWMIDSVTGHFDTSLVTGQYRSQSGNHTIIPPLQYLEKGGSVFGGITLACIFRKLRLGFDLIENNRGFRPLPHQLF